ncbi:pyruvate kinase [Chromatium okenii]|uniref:pyruvate kinase n=1 Tax=Chromatium okenii TaxID=61644 RepID=UPI001F5B8DEC|nr:pyruvate kinase [Chromatium okenii]
MPRRTKIVATLGPATDDPAVMDNFIAAGVDVVRLNLSHDSHARHRERAERFRERGLAINHEVRC